MEHYRLNLRGARPAFDDVPAQHRRCAFGVEYVAIRGMQGGEFYFTRAGWAIAPGLLPCVWYDNERFRRIGKPLPKATGSVYLVPITHPARTRFGLVVKFCRFAQDIGCTRLESGLLPAEVGGLLAGGEFAGPFEEFGRVRELRAARVGPEGRFRTNPTSATGAAEKRKVLIHRLGRPKVGTTRARRRERESWAVVGAGTRAGDVRAAR